MLHSGSHAPEGNKILAAMHHPPLDIPPTPLPIAVLDAGPLIQIGRGEEKFVVMEAAWQKPADHAPLDLLTPLMARGQCTLVIPRQVVQEVVRQETGAGHAVEYGVIAGSGAAQHHHAAQLATAETIPPGSARRIYDFLKQAEDTTVKGIPQLRYYPSVQEFLHCGEAENRTGGIAIVDTREAALRQPLTPDGTYHATADTQRGDVQIQSIIHGLEQAYPQTAACPIVSGDYRMMRQVLGQAEHGAPLANQPFPMNLRALISFEQRLGLFDPHTEAALYALTNPPEQPLKAPTAQSGFRDRSIAAAEHWMDALHQEPGTIVSQPRMVERNHPGRAI